MIAISKATLILLMMCQFIETNKLYLIGLHMDFFMYGFGYMLSILWDKNDTTEVGFFDHDNFNLKIFTSRSM